MKIKYTYFDNREQYDEAVEAALNSTDGVREVLYSKDPLEVTLQKDVWQGNTGTMTTVDYYLEVR